MATAPIYCTHKELKRVYPNIDAFDAKTPIYGWVSGLTDFLDSSLDIFYTANSGLITDLFIDGVKVDKIAYNTTENTQVKTLIEPSAVTIDVDSTSNFSAGDIIKINNEYMRVTGVTDVDTLAIATPETNRGLFGTSATHHAVDSSVYKIIDVSADIGDATSAGQSYIFLYDTDLDLCLLVGDDLTTNSPDNNLIEAGEEFTTLITQFRTDASRYLDSKLDPNLPREQLKDKSGKFDYMIIRTTALIAATFLIRATDPTSETALALLEEAQGNIDALNSGNAALSWQNTRDASRGLIREVSTINGSIRPVDTRGYWGGTYDLIKLKIDTTGGTLGTATYSVWVKDGTKLKNMKVVDQEKITGDYQALAGGLEVRFAGEGDASLANAGDEWEIEVMGVGEKIDASGVKSVNNTRWL